LGERVVDSSVGKLHGELKSPGLLEKHYAPRARLLILSWNDEAELASKLGELGIDSKSAHILAHAVVPSGSNFHGVSVIPHDPEAYARGLYAELHRADQAGVMVIIAEAVPDEPRWQAIADRLGRASAP
jgi:L-threonylcarbamoyladenylate synthase